MHNTALKKHIHKPEKMFPGILKITLEPSFRIFVKKRGQKQLQKCSFRFG